MTCPLALCLAIASFTVIDGDTLRRPGAPNVRLWGIDAPELGEARGPAARDALRALVEGRPLACDPLDVDRYGRDVARCFLPDGTDIACAMVALGHARDWPRYSGGAYSTCRRD